MKGLSRCLVGAGTWLMPGKPAKAGEKAQADESCLLCFAADWKGPKKVPVRAGTRQEPAARGGCRLAEETSRRRVGTLRPLPFLSPCLRRPAASVYHLSCPSFLRELTLWLRSRKGESPPRSEK